MKKKRVLYSKREFGVVAVAGRIQIIHFELKIMHAKYFVALYNCTVHTASSSDVTSSIDLMLSKI